MGLTHDAAPGRELTAISQGPSLGLLCFHEIDKKAFHGAIRSDQEFPAGAEMRLVPIK